MWVQVARLWLSNWIVNLNIGMLFVNQWRRPTGQDKEVEPKMFKLPKNSTTFKDYYNNVQGSLKGLAGMDDFLTGWLVVHT